MGDLRQAPFSKHHRPSPGPASDWRSLSDEALVTALLAAPREGWPEMADALAGELHARLRLLGAVMGAISEGVLALDRRGGVTYVNPAAEALLGFAPGAGEPVGFIVKAQEGCYAPEDTLREGRTLRCDSMLRRGDGSTFPAAITCAPIFDAGAVAGAVLVFRDDTERLRAEEARRKREAETRYLAEATMELAERLDYGEALEQVVRLAVPRLATWCMVHAPDEHGFLRCAALAHEDPRKEAMAREYQERYAPREEGRSLVAEAYRTGRPVLVERITDDLLRDHAAGDEERLRFMRALGATSCIVVALSARGHVIGTLSLIAGLNEEPFSWDDLPFIQEIARPAAVALDNARLFAAEHRSRQEAEQAARHLAILKDRYESLATATANAVFVADAEGRATTELPHWSAITGQAPGETAGWGWVDAYHPDDQERAKRDWAEAVRERRIFEGDYRVRLRDGSYRVFAFRVVPVFEPDGTIREWVGSCVDVTERRQIETQLRQSEERHRMMVEMIPDPIAVHQHGMIVYANPATVELMGVRSADELIGRPIMDFVHPTSQSFVAERMRQMERTQEPLPLADVRVLRTDGRVLDVQVAVMPIPYDREPAAQLLLRDVTAERAAAEQLRRFSETLEARVRDRTAEMAALNRELEAFSYTVSHDLRAPLRGVSTFASILSEEHAQEFSPEARELVDRIRRDADRMGQLIQDLLTLSRTGRGEVMRERFDLAELARTVWATVARQDPAREIAFVTPPDLWVDADPRLLRVVLENLLGNAWKFTGRTEHPRVELGAAERGGALAYFVRDNGAGFDMAQADRLFQPFQRLHEGGEFEGTGVGLATVARIIRRHGGRVQAEGARGRGATIWFTLGGAAG